MQHHQTRFLQIFFIWQQYSPVLRQFLHQLCIYVYTINTCVKGRLAAEIRERAAARVSEWHSTINPHQPDDTIIVWPVTGRSLQHMKDTVRRLL